MNQELNQDFSSVYGDIAGRDVVRKTTVHIAQQTIIHHHHAPRSALPAQLARNAPPAPATVLTLQQKKLLQLMKPLPRLARINVLDHLRTNYGTAMVRELSPQAVAKAYLHVLGLGLKND